MTQAELRELAKLSGILIDDAEIGQYINELEEMMDYLMLPTIAEEIISSQSSCVLREDIPIETKDTEKESEEFYWVPKIL